MNEEYIKEIKKERYFERDIKKCYAQGGNIDGCYIDGVLYEYDKTKLSSKKKR